MGFVGKAGLFFVRKQAGLRAMVLPAAFLGSTFLESDISIFGFVVFCCAFSGLLLESACCVGYRAASEDRGGRTGTHITAFAGDAA